MQTESKLSLLIFPTCLKVLWGKKLPNFSNTKYQWSVFPWQMKLKLQPIIQDDIPHIMFARFNCMTNKLVHNVLRIARKVKSIICMLQTRSKQTTHNTASFKWDVSIQTIYYVGWLCYSTEHMDKRIVLQESKDKQKKKNWQCNPIYLEHLFKCRATVFISVF
jgi:hypothetical protein